MTKLEKMILNYEFYNVWSDDKCTKNNTLNKFYICSDINNKNSVMNIKKIDDLENAYVIDMNGEFINYTNIITGEINSIYCGDFYKIFKGKDFYSIWFGDCYKNNIQEKEDEILKFISDFVVKEVPEFKLFRVSDFGPIDTIVYQLAGKKNNFSINSDEYLDDINSKLNPHEHAIRYFSDFIPVLKEEYSSIIAKKELEENGNKKISKKDYIKIDKEVKHSLLLF